MQLIKLVVKLSNHGLNISTLFLCIKLLENSTFNILFVQHPLLQESYKWLLGYDIAYLGILVTSE